MKHFSREYTTHHRLYYSKIIDIKTITEDFALILNAF
jgi:hypothetical protein